MAKTYDENSIKKMDPRTFCRHRPDVYLGSSANSTQLVKEIVSNSVDEAIAGNCSTIWVDIDYSKNKVKVRDNGQGILPNVWKDNHTVLEMVYGDINTSGKYEHDENSAYKISTGAFGIGGALSNWLSKTFTAQTSRGGCTEVVNFQDGLFEDRDVFRSDPKEHGVVVEFMPDPQFFDDPHPNESELVSYLRDVVCLVPNLTIEYNGRVFKSANGISDILENWSHESADLTPKRFKCEFDDTTNNKHLYCAAMFRDTSEAVFSAFCNYAPIEGGAPMTAIKTVITKVFNSWGQDNGILKENEKLSGNAIQEGIVFAFNLVSNDIRYDSQTKVRVTSTTDNDFIATNLTSALTKWLNDNPQQSKALIEKSVIAKRAAEAAKRARDAVKGKKNKKEKVFKLPTKLTDCWTKDRKKAELILCEGLSAASSLVSARNSQYQAVYGVRGKMLSVLKTTPVKILENQEINNIVQALGLDVDVKTAKMVYDAKKLRYNKIIANCDAK
jgi:DNA gyrase subunit B